MRRVKVVNLDNELKQTVRELGSILGETIEAQLGTEWLQRIEDIRLHGRESHSGVEESTDNLKTLFETLQDEDLLTVARAFSQFLNLANIAEQEYNSSHNLTDSMQALFGHLDDVGVTQHQFSKAFDQLHIDLVLTAHPTEVTRRTLIHKYTELADCLRRIHQHGLSSDEREIVKERVAALISQAWHTNEIRSQRPTPIDEAKWGFAVIENSLWDAVPSFVRTLDKKVQEKYSVELPLDAAPVHFNSWMGGDRDGNPFVTSTVTETVLLLARKTAAELFFKDVEHLIAELSMSHCSQELNNVSGQGDEPYRSILRPLAKRLKTTFIEIGKKLRGEVYDSDGWLEDNDELLEPLLLCYRSLRDSDMKIIAENDLLDTIRRANCFGIHLLKLDVRQDSERHANVFGELSRYLGMGDYEQWTESEKQAFLLQELNSKRPLFPNNWQPSDDVKEVLDTCKVIANNSANGFGIYIISMASLPSDVLAVQLLLKEMGCTWPMPVAPLFETLDDLNNAKDVMTSLFDIDWYLGYIKGRQHVMIGYSDSAKDAGALAAGWAQYEAQESLVVLADKHNVELTLFHGRGGTIGRGGLPAHGAILSQPPGSLKGGFRVTEQGETIRYKFGTPVLAVQSLSLYASAILEGIMAPPPAPKKAWREIMTTMAAAGRDNYRAVVRHNEEFVPYFRVATPEQELGKLPLGSRPAKRRPQGGIESLRAIPWIFAWAQTRMVLPSWLGVMKALRTSIDSGNSNIIKEMIEDWPFFKSRLSMLDMVFSKADAAIGAEYDKRLVPDELRHFGEALRQELAESMRLLLELLEQKEVLESDPKAKESMSIRASYLQPLHFLQIELLNRIRASEEDDKATLERAMMITIAGIAIGMRNTG
jgi:phosphoenolpyruvate carboxylase